MAKREQRPAATRSGRRTTRPRQKSAREAAGPAPLASPAGAPPPPGPSDEAISGFEQAMRALQAHDYGHAARLFEQLLGGYSAPRDRPLLDRARVYLDLCQRELRRHAPAPITVEERLTLATAALNNDDDAEAERLAREVLADVPDNDLALYLLAAVSARRGDSKGALERLRRALQISPDVGAQARHDADFEFLKASPEFQALVELAAPTGRKVQDGRADR